MDCQSLANHRKKPNNYPGPATQKPLFVTQDGPLDAGKGGTHPLCGPYFSHRERVDIARRLLAGLFPRNFQKNFQKNPLDNISFLKHPLKPGKCFLQPCEGAFKHLVVSAKKNTRTRQQFFVLRPLGIRVLQKNM